MSRINNANHPNVLDDMAHDDVAEMTGHFIVNQLGINLCSVDRIKVFRKADRQIKKIVINFIPTEHQD
jgi:hypothetical protein